MAYWKAIAWAALGVTVLTAAQYGSVHLLSGRPDQWVFEASLDLAPPLLFVGDTVQFMVANGSQVALREQLSAVLVGMLVNTVLYSIVIWAAAWSLTSAKRTK